MKKNIILVVALLISYQLVAQNTEIKGAKSVNVVISLIGKSIENAKTILSKENFENKVSKKYDDLKVEIFPFYPKNIKENDKEFEPLFILECKKGIVVLVNLSYEYTNHLFCKNDFENISKQLKINNYAEDEGRHNVEQSFGGGFGKSRIETIWYKNKNNYAAFILNNNNESINFVIGDSKLAEITYQDSK